MRDAGISALVVDHVWSGSGTVADQLELPFATVCNVLLLHPDPATPPFFTHWQPRDAMWAQLRNRVGWAALERLYRPIITQVREHRRKLVLPLPKRRADVWSRRVQISQQPELLTFPRRKRPEHMHFVGPLRLPGGYPDIPFPWERLDERPLIYASLGTLQNRVTATFHAIAEACRVSMLNSSSRPVTESLPRHWAICRGGRSWCLTPRSWRSSAGPPWR